MLNTVQVECVYHIFNERSTNPIYLIEQFYVNIVIDKNIFVNVMISK